MEEIILKIGRDIILTHDNVLVRKSILNMFPATFVTSFLMMFLFMVDITLLNMMTKYSQRSA